LVVLVGVLWSAGFVLRAERSAPDGWSDSRTARAWESVFGHVGIEVPSLASVVFGVLGVMAASWLFAAVHFEATRISFRLRGAIDEGLRRSRSGAPPR